MSDAQPIPTPPRQRLERFKRTTLPALVWTSAAIACGVLLLQKNVTRDYIGLAQAHEYRISAPTTGTITAMPVALFDAVESGDILVTLDESLLLAQIDTARASINQLTAELEAARAELGSGGTDYQRNLRRFRMDEEDRRLEMLALQVVIEEARIESERLSLELQRQSPLITDGLISELEYDNTRLLHEQARQRLDRNRLLLSETESEYEAARERRLTFQRGGGDPGDDDVLLGPIRESIGVEAARLREIEAQRRAHVLRSPIRGRVSQVLARQGQAVRPGEPIVMVAETAVTEIVAYLNETDPRRPEASSAVLLGNLRDPQRVAESIVLSVSPTIQQLPQQLWRDPRTPSYGRAVRIAATPALELVPGEQVRVRFSER